MTPPGIAIMDSMMAHPWIAGFWVVGLYLFLAWLLYQEWKKL